MSKPEPKIWMVVLLRMMFPAETASVSAFPYVCPEPVLVKFIVFTQMHKMAHKRRFPHAPIIRTLPTYGTMTTTDSAPNGTANAGANE